MFQLLGTTSYNHFAHLPENISWLLYQGIHENTLQ